jgi:hypothetical protein
MRMPLLAVLMVVSAPLYAGTATVHWTNATQNTDGSSIPASGAGSLVSTRVEYGSCSGTAFGTKAGEVTANAPATSAVITLGPGTYCFRAFSRNTYGSESAASGVATKTIQAPTPSPPTLTTIDTAAYQVVPKTNQFAFVKVGTVPLGAPCVAGQSVNTYTVVPRWKVKWSGWNRPSVVVAKCAANA